MFGNSSVISIPDCPRGFDAHQFLAQARASLRETAVPEDRKNREALAALMRVLMSSNEFVTLD